MRILREPCSFLKSRAGRPRDPAKRRAILDAAIKLFTLHSYGAVTMEAVAARAGVSKMTIYRHFADKESLFEAIVTSVSDRMITVFSGSGTDDRPLYDRLMSTGIAFLSIILEPDVMGLAAMLPTALRGNQELTLRFHNAGPGRVKPVLAAMIATAAESGQIVIDNPEWAASDLISLWESGLKPAIDFGTLPPIEHEEIVRRVHRGTSLFLRAYAPVSASG